MRFFQSLIVAMQALILSVSHHRNATLADSILVPYLVILTRLFLHQEGCRCVRGRPLDRFVVRRNEGFTAYPHGADDEQLRGCVHTRGSNFSPARDKYASRGHTQSKLWTD